MSGGTTTCYWYEVDVRGNVVALADSTGNVVDRYSYDLWGKPVSVSEAAGAQQHLRYAGYWYDNELGWYWLSVRSYSPTLERFLQPDPSQQEGLFSYTYVGDPVDFTDPSGRLFGLGCRTSVLGGRCVAQRNVTEGLGDLAIGACSMAVGEDSSTVTDVPARRPAGTCSKRGNCCTSAVRRCK